MTFTLYIFAFLTVLQPSTGVGTEFRGAAAAAAKIDATVQVGSEGAAVTQSRRAESGHDDGSTRREISSRDVRVAVEELFQKRFPAIAERLEVRVVRIGATVESPSAIGARLTHSESIPRGHTQVRLTARNGGAWEDAGWALLYIAHFDSVAIAETSVPQGDRVDRSDVKFVWMETTTFRGDPLRPEAYRSLTSDHLYADSPLRSGEAIRLNDLRPPFLADTGQSITMTYRRGDLELKLTCRAREPGVRGDVIRAYSSDTKATYKVELTGPGTATWISTL